MKKNYWFKAKNYGWGWYPSTWQGWLILLVYLGFMLWNFYGVDSQSHSASDTLINVMPQAVFATLILIVICYKTGEKPEWRWGGKKNKK